MTSYKIDGISANQSAERELIDSARLGNAYAFELLADKYLLILEWHIRKLNMPVSEKDDLVQEGLIGLLKAVRTYDGVSSSFGTYASVCIKNSIISAVRKYKKYSVNNISYDGVLLNKHLYTVLTPEMDFIKKENAVFLYEKSLKALSGYEKKIFGLYLMGKSYNEIASKLGQTEKSAENAVYRIRKKLRKIAVTS